MEASSDTPGTAAEDSSGFRNFFVFFESEDLSLEPDESLSGVDKLDMNALEITNWGKGRIRASLTLTFPAKTLPISFDVGDNKWLREL